MSTTQTRLPHALDRVLSIARQPWAITPDMLCTIAGILAHRLAHGPHDVLALAPPVPRALEDAAPANGVALIPLHGVIAPRMTALTDISGGTTFERTGQTLDAMVADPDVRTIVLDVDSPGGSVLGARVFAHKVLAARTRKPVVAVAHFQMCSAAYWVCAGATEIVAVPGAQVGSLGVYMVHDDISAALTKEGITRTLISAGENKLDGNPAVPLSDGARERFQLMVDEHHAHFLADVIAGRGRDAHAVRAWKADVFSAERALSVGMVDRVATLDDTLARFGASVPSPPLAAPPASRHAAGAAQVATGQDRAPDRALERSLYELDLL